MRENDWVNKNVDLRRLSEMVQQFFYDDGFSEVKVDEDPNGTWFELQAKKMGALRTIVSSRKAIHVIIKGEPNKFTVSIGTGEWGKNFVVAGVFTGGIGLVGMGLNLRFTNKVWNFIKETIDSLENSYTGTTKSTRKKGTSKSTRKKGTSKSTRKKGTSKSCGECGATIKPTSKFCSECGSSTP
jgi:hypothetical protein